MYHLPLSEKDLNITVIIWIAVISTLICCALSCIYCIKVKCCGKHKMYIEV